MPYALVETAWGSLGVSYDEHGVHHVALPDPDPAGESAAERLARQTGCAEAERTPPPPVRRLLTSLIDYFAGEPVDFDVAVLDMRALTPFTRAIYAALCQVPRGQTVRYGELAARAGSPGAPRAVGRAMATNPWPIVVPCHRVLAAGKQGGGYSAPGGLLTKDRLLVMEGAAVIPRSTTAEPSAERRHLAVAEAHLAARDAELGAFMARVGPCGLQVQDELDPFGYLMRSVVFQQLTGKAATTIFGRLRDLFPDRHPDPAALLALDDETLRAAGLSSNKCASLRALAEHALAGRIPSLRQAEALDDEALIAALTPVRGIGRWTVEMLLMFRLGRLDVMATGDFGLRKGFARLFCTDATRTEPRMPSPAQMLARAEHWRPYRSVAAWYLWRAAEG